MKHLILKVLDKYENTQTNLGSKSAREMIATDIEKILEQHKQIIKIERELYRGEG